MNNTNINEKFFSSKNFFIAITYQCNAFCEKCLTRYSRFKNQSMSKNNCERLVKLLIDNKYSGTINLGSGENLTYTLFPYFVETLLNAIPTVKFRILSNGMLFSSKLPEFFFSPRITWGITLDGFYNTELSNLQKGIDIEIVKNNIRSVCNLGHSKNLYINYTMNNQNVNSLKDYIDFANELHIPQIFTTQMKIYEGFKHLDKYRLNDEDLVHIKNMKDYAAALSFEKVYFDTAEEYTQRDRCFLKKGGIHPIIDMDCSLSFCYGREDTFLGSIFEYETLEKWNDLYNNLVQNDEMAKNWCNKCLTKKDESGYFSVPISTYPYLKK